MTLKKTPLRTKQVTIVRFGLRGMLAAVLLTLPLTVWAGEREPHAGHGGGAKAAAGSSDEVTKMEVSDAFRGSLAPVYKAYATVYDALTRDDLAAARGGYVEIGKAVDKVEMSKVTGHAHMVWMKRQAHLAHSATLGREAATLDAARDVFGGLSSEMVALVYEFGYAGGDPLVQAYCPMASGGKGAKWLQSGERIRNPYYGTKMLSCGEIQERFGAAQAGHVRQRGCQGCSE